MPEVNRNQFNDPILGFLEREGREEAGMARQRATWPTHEQLPLPGIGERQSEQMRLFDTHRAGPANVYALNPSQDAAAWRDQDIDVPLGEEQQALVEDDEHTISGEFFEFPIGRDDREFMAYGSAHHEKIGETHEAGTHLGHDPYPTQTNPGIQFGDLDEAGDGVEERRWFTEEGTEVGRISYHEDDWGPNVDYAEINPLYRGRGFSRDALSQVAGGLEPGEGVMHAGSFTSAGHGAFQKKGIPTEDDLERGFQDWVAGLEPDEHDVQYMLEMNYPEEDWDSPDAPHGFADQIREELRQEMFDDPQTRVNFREQLEEMQSQVLSNLPTSRKGAFVEGWKPKGPTYAHQEELPEMPQKYFG